MQLDPQSPPRRRRDQPTLLVQLQQAFKNACRRALYWSGMPTATGPVYSAGPRRSRKASARFCEAMIEARECAASIAAITGKKPALPTLLDAENSNPAQQLLPLRWCSPSRGRQSAVPAPGGHDKRHSRRRALKSS